MKPEYSRAAQIVAAFVLLSFVILLLIASEQVAADIIPKSSKVVTDNQPNSEEMHKVQGHKLYLSLGDQFSTPLYAPQEIFDCTDKIYTVLELQNHPLGKHQLSVRWIDPNGTVREHTQYDFHVRIQNTRLWAWLSLSRGFGSGMLKWANPAAGLEEFIGLWEIDVKVDGKRVSKENFEVSC